MADIFLSYAREDREKAERLAKALEGQGWSVFWDRETPVGVAWREHIENELAQSKCVLVAWSSSSVKSEWVLEEAEDGKGRKVLIPVSLEANVRPPFGFRTLQSLDLATWAGSTGESSFERLLKGLTRYLGDPPGRPEAPTEARAADPPTRNQDEELNRRILIEGGHYLMGSAEGVGRNDEHPRHRVRVSPFYLQAHPVTNEEYRRYRPDHDYDEGKEMHPAVNVSWESSSTYAEWLGGRLPTEAEWEYACRAGTETRYWSGDSERDLARVGWYEANSNRGTHEVGKKPANPWGLYDMHGNVWEWVADWSGPYPETPQVEPVNRDSSSGRRLFRGSSFGFPADAARSARRGRDWPDIRVGDLGFRVASDAAPGDKKD